MVGATAGADSAAASSASCHDAFVVYLLSGLCALLLFLALLVSVNIGLTLWLLFTVRLDLVSPRFISCFVTLLWLWQKRSEICQNFFSERWGTSHLCPWGAQGGGLH